MGVYYRTGPRSAVGVPWLVYFMFVLPLQVMVWLFRIVALVCVGLVMLAAFCLHEARRGWKWWNERKPPHPAG